MEYSTHFCNEVAMKHTFFAVNVWMWAFLTYALHFYIYLKFSSLSLGFISYMHLSYFSKSHPQCLAELKILKRNPLNPEEEPLNGSFMLPSRLFSRNDLEKYGDSHCGLDYLCRLLWSQAYGNNLIWCEGEGIFYSNWLYFIIYDRSAHCLGYASCLI